MSEEKQIILAVNVGNSRTQFALYDVRVAGNVPEVISMDNTDTAGIASRVADLVFALADDEDTTLAICLASVNDPVADILKEEIKTRCASEVLRAGADLPVPLKQDLEREAIVGVDRLLNALAAYTVTEQACIVVDAGTAVTVDYVDEAGVFRGGAILPGTQLMLDALAQRGALLPRLEYHRPDDQHTWGRNTAQAMIKGVHFGIRGAVRGLVERYSGEIGSYPKVIATGGNADDLFRNDELVENIVPHLTLLGIALTCASAS